MENNKYSWWEFIKYVLSFIFHRKKENSIKKAEEFNKASEKLKEEYAKIDEEKEKQRDRSVENRLNNIFK